ncbi:hypothetical protein G6011_07150 [Alternaria panax]|uniref:Uncharacterized protein n=1 Tax=Alternaria panax TaxID=48097 RepID=A0AAD4I7P5_9PLEO|nr:hypothetical protein G6011_07150 [Alternaria panax]
MLRLSSGHAGLAIAHLVCGTTAGIAVAIRMYAKLKTKQGIKSDDVFILLTLLFYYGAMLFTNFAPFSVDDMENMASKDYTVRLQIYRKAMLAAFLLAMTAQYTCKMSILLFYRCIFFASKFHRDISLGLLIFCLLVVAIRRVVRTRYLPASEAHLVPGTAARRGKMWKLDNNGIRLPRHRRARGSGHPDIAHPNGLYSPNAPTIEDWCRGDIRTWGASLSLSVL